MTMARALSNHQFREPTEGVDQVQHDANRQLGPLRRTMPPARQDWLSEFPPESAPPQEPAMWVEVPHAHVAPPPHTEFLPFSPVSWIRTHPSFVRACALALAVVSTALVGVAAWMQRQQQQSAAVITQSATSEPLLARPIVTPPPAPPTVFTSESATPSPAAAIVPSAAGGAASARAEEKTPAPPLASASRDRADTPPVRATAPPPARVTVEASGRAASSSPSRGFVPPLPQATPPGRSSDVQAPPPVTGASSSSASTVTTSRPPVDRAPLILSSPAREAVTTPAVTPAPAPAPPPPSPEARETAAVEAVLERYRLAFSTLNSGVSDFWPGVPSRALDKAFNELESQSFDFDQCRVQLKGSQADATCTGTATFVPKVGDKTPRTQSRQWSFRLVRAGNRWIIDSVHVR
jgi:hypothetical protein